MMTEYVTIPLDIEGVQVNHVRITTDDEVHIHVTSTVDGTLCHRCGQEIKEVYDYGREIKLRYLPILDRPTYIFIKPRRYICRDCRGTRPRRNDYPGMNRAVRPPKRMRSMC
jgi:transposase